MKKFAVYVGKQYYGQTFAETFEEACKQVEHHPNLQGKCPVTVTEIEKEDDVEMRKKRSWIEDILPSSYPVLPTKELVYHIVEIKLVGDVVEIQTIYTVEHASEADLINKAIKELEPKAKYYVRCEVKG